MFNTPMTSPRSVRHPFSADRLQNNPISNTTQANNRRQLRNVACDAKTRGGLRGCTHYTKRCRLPMAVGGSQGAWRAS